MFSNTLNIHFKLWLLQRGQALSEITQWQYLKWPDHGVPQEEANVLEFRGKIKKSMTGSGRMLIHCRFRKIHKYNLLLIS